jgi:2-polyprenyl-6-methoxyphenol hydroxylase-like FAD-dependent oxidoreductase
MRRVVVVGGGPVGIFCALALVRQGEQVTVVDRDPGPPTDGIWTRRGVMQFLHPHGFRPIIRQALLDVLPDVYDRLIAAGAIAARPEGAPDQATGLQCRRSTFERALWLAAAKEPGLIRRTGHADAIDVSGSRITGVIVDGDLLPADLVLVATGRAGRLGETFRPPAEGGDCGFSYLSRMYRARPGVQVPRTGIPMGAEYEGYLAIVFPQDDNTLSVLVVRASDDLALQSLRVTTNFDNVAPHIPQLAPWVDPDRFQPITNVLIGGGLTNTYRPHGPTPVPGLLYVGDTVNTTNPAAGRGISLGLQQARQLLTLLANENDTTVVARHFDAWCHDNIRPWFEDHLLWDATQLNRFRGHDIDVCGPIPSDVVCAAASEDPSIQPAASAYTAMTALPSILDPHRESVRALLIRGWRPTRPDEPTRDDLAGLLAQTSRETAPQMAS